MNAHNVYLSWAVYAVCGQLREADAILREHGAAVREVAALLRERFPIPLQPLYRGVLLTDAEAAAGAIAALPHAMSTSFTEDVDCARWFACRGASVSGAIVEEKPSVRGYLLEYAPRPDEVLFHRDWRRVPTPPKFDFIDLYAAALYAEEQGAIPPTGAWQTAWALRTQSEVVLEAIREPIPIRPVGPVDAAALETKYGPPTMAYAVSHRPFGHGGRHRYGGKS